MAGIGTPRENALDALLCAYRREGTLASEDLERMYPKIEPAKLASFVVDLENLGWIEFVAGGGHRITAAGERRYLAS